MSFSLFIGMMNSDYAAMVRQKIIQDLQEISNRLAA